MVVLIVATLLVASSAHPTNRVTCNFPGAMLVGNGTDRNQCLYFSHQHLNWTNAVEECTKTNNGTLASLLDPKAVLDYARKSLGGIFFVGASDTANEGRYVWLNGQKLDYDNTPWYVTEPNGGTKQNCLVLDADGDAYGYGDAPCNGIARFICDVGKNWLGVVGASDATYEVTCNFPGANLVGNQCLLFSNEVLNWTDAVEECKEKDGGTLASLLDPKAVLDYSRNNLGIDGYGFVGASDAAREGWFVWLNGQELDYDNLPWASGQPDGGTDENCLWLDNSQSDVYGYRDINCSRPGRFICDVGKNKLGVVGASDATNQDTCTFPGAELVGNQCLLFTNQKENWDDSVEACKAMDGTLASLEDPRGVYEYALKKGKTWIGWVGASDVKEEGQYVWLNGRALMYDDVPWHNKSATHGNQPNGGTLENCLWMDTRATYGYYDIKCSEKGQILCDVGGVSK